MSKVLKFAVKCSCPFHCREPTGEQSFHNAKDACPGTSTLRRPAVYIRNLQQQCTVSCFLIAAIFTDVYRALYAPAIGNTDSSNVEILRHSLITIINHLEICITEERIRTLRICRQGN